MSPHTGAIVKDTTGRLWRVRRVHDSMLTADPLNGARGWALLPVRDVTVHEPHPDRVTA